MACTAALSPMPPSSMSTTTTPLLRRESHPGSRGRTPEPPLQLGTPQLLLLLEQLLGPLPPLRLLQLMLQARGQPPLLPLTQLLRLLLPRLLLTQLLQPPRLPQLSQLLLPQLWPAQLSQLLLELLLRPPTQLLENPLQEMCNRMQELS